MKYSKLSHEIEVMDLNHKHETQLLKMKHGMEKKKLLSRCNHKYDDGTSAKEFAGNQFDSFHICGICKEIIY